MRYSGGRFKLRVGFEVNRPDVPTPPELIVFSMLCVTWLAVFLAIVVGRQMSAYGAAPVSTPEAILWAIFGGVMPMVVAHSIAMNLPASRWLALLTVAALAGLACVWLDVERGTVAEQLLMLGSAVVAVLLIVWWLFYSPRMRAYFALIGGRPVPAGLDGHLDGLMRPRAGPFGQLVLRAGPWLEAIGALLVLFAVGYGLWITGA